MRYRICKNKFGYYKVQYEVEDASKRSDRGRKFNWVDCYEDYSGRLRIFTDEGSAYCFLQGRYDDSFVEAKVYEV